MRTFLSILLLVFLSLSCEKEYPFDVIPYISLNHVSTNSVKQLSEPISFSISYTDGDGDLGENATGIKNLFLIDNRINIEYTFRIQDLVPGEGAIPIKGNLQFSIPNTFLTTQDSTEIVYYNIYVVDRAGHKSNQIIAGPITVYK